MKRLTLIRHGEASWYAYSDFERPLTPRGEQDVKQLAKKLKQSGETFDQIYASGAQRTTTTAALLCAGLGVDFENVMQPESLYLAEADALLHIINEIDEKIQSIAIIAHNPGLSDLAGKLGKKPVNMAPADMIQFDIDRAWQDI